MKLLRTLALIALLPLVSSAALARPPMETNQLVDDTGTPIGTASNPLVTSGGTTTTSGALQPPTAASSKITKTSTALSANASTTIALANPNRIAFSVQCGSGGVSVDETGAALTGASVGNGTLFVPANPGAYFTPPIATLTAITAYTATAQTCVVTEYLR